MSIFETMNNPGTSSRPGYFAPGNYTATLTGLRKKMSEDPKKRGTQNVIAEFVVAESSNPEVPVGSPRVWVVSIPPTIPGTRNERAEQAVADVKCLLFALLGTDPQNAAAVRAFEEGLAAKGAKVSDLFEQATGERNPFAGARVRVECTAKRTRDGGTFTVHTWSPAPAVGG